MAMLFLGAMALSLALLGWGQALSRALLRQEGRFWGEISLLELGLLGAGAAGMLVCWCNVLGVATAPASTAFLLLGGAFSLAWRPRLAMDGLAMGCLATGCLVAVLLLPWAIPTGDTGLYHLQAVLWSVADPFPLGLANVHDRFGFNSLWHAAAGVAMPWPLGPDAAGVTFLPSLCCLGLLCGSAARRLALDGGSRRPSGLLEAGAGLLCLGLACLGGGAVYPGFFHDNLLGLSTDLPALALTAACVRLALVCQETPPGSRKGAQAARLLLLLVAIAGLVKLSLLPLLLLAGLGFWRRRRAWRVPRLWAFLALLAGGWLARGVLLSGHLLFPLPWTRLELPWSVPAAKSANQLAWIKAWARSPGTPPEQIHGWDWLPGWGETVSRLPDLWLLGGACLLGLLALAARRAVDPRTREDRRAMRPVAACLVLGLGYWFLQAPDPRLGLGWLLTLAALPWAAALAGAPTGAVAGGAAWSRGLAALPLAAAILLALAGAPRWAGSRVAPEAALFPRLPARDNASDQARDVTRHGLEVRRPRDGLCWDAPRPCVFEFDLDLRETRLGGATAFIKDESP